VDYNLMTTVPGLFALGEANFSDHGANRLGASALMQGLADGYFVAPYTIGTYLSKDITTGKISTNLPEFEEAENNARKRMEGFLNNNGNTPVESFHRDLGKIMWSQCGMARNEKGLKKAIADIRSLRDKFYAEVKVTGKMNEMNPELDKAGRVADFLELGELMCMDALAREESCGGHFREEYQSKEGEAVRKDDEFAFVSAWEFSENDPGKSKLHKEELSFENVELNTRSYK
jgi:succinate dehydrogenase / fumarate reductase flavoprotein subunit